MELNDGLGWRIKTGTAYMAFSNILTLVLVIVFQILAVRLLKPEQYGLVSILYSAVLLVSSLLGQPFELALARYISEYEALGADCHHLIKRILFWQAMACLCFGIITLALRSVVIENIFFDSPGFFYIFVLSGVFWGIEIGIRGILRGLREFGYYGALPVVLNISRILILLLLVIVMDQGVIGAGLSILLASIVTILAVFYWYPRVHNRLKGAGKQPIFTLWQLLQIIAPMIALYGAASYLFSIGPVFIKLFADRAANELAGLFMIVAMMTRLPLQLSDALFANLLPNMSRVSAKGDWQKFKYYVTRSNQLFIPFMGVLIIGVYFWGPYALQLFYPEYSYSRSGMTILMIGTAIIVLANLYGLVLYARSKMLLALAAWVAGCLALTAVVFIASWDILRRLEIGYLLGGMTILILQAIFAYREMGEMRANIQAKVLIDQ